MVDHFPALCCVTTNKLGTGFGKIPRKARKPSKTAKQLGQTGKKDNHTQCVGSARDLALPILVSRLIINIASTFGFQFSSHFKCDCTMHLQICSTRYCSPLSIIGSRALISAMAFAFSYSGASDIDTKSNFPSIEDFSLRYSLCLCNTLGTTEICCRRWCQGLRRFAHACTMEKWGSGGNAFALCGLLL